MTLTFMNTVGGIEWGPQRGDHEVLAVAVTELFVMAKCLPKRGPRARPEPSVSVMFEGTGHLSSLSFRAFEETPGE